MNSSNCSVGQRKHWYDDCKAQGFPGFLTLHKYIKLQLNSSENCSVIYIYIHTHFLLGPVCPVCTLSSTARTQLHSLAGAQGGSLTKSKSTLALNI